MKDSPEPPASHQRSPEPSRAEPEAYFHVRIKSAGSHTTALDLTLEQLEERVLAPYRAGRPIALRGNVIRPGELEGIRISETSQPSESLRPGIEAERARRMFSPYPVEWYIADSGRDRTDDLIQGPPGYAAESKQEPEADPRKVLVVHGRNETLRAEFFAFLRSLSLQPLEWSQLVQATGEGAPYVGDVLERAFALAKAVVVLLTPDDEARLKAALRRSGDADEDFELRSQPRQNVIFEAGMAMGWNAAQSVLVQVGRIRGFSDVAGRHIVRIDNSPEKRKDLAERLRVLGCAVDTSGSDWLRTGDLELAPD